MNDVPETRASLLLRLQQAEDDAAWAEFVAIYEPAVYRLARRRGLQDADAKDLCQEVLRLVAKAIAGWNPDPARGSFRGWLFRIARNQAVDHLTRARRQPRGTGDSEVHRRLADLAAPHAATVEFDAEYRRQVFRWAADVAKHEFAAATWEAFRRTAVEAEPVRTVAAALNISVGAVYIARSRVIARLREIVERASLEFPFDGEADGHAN